MIESMLLVPSCAIKKNWLEVMAIIVAKIAVRWANHFLVSSKINKIARKDNSIDGNLMLKLLKPNNVILIFCNSLKGKSISIDYVVSEIPPPVGNFSAGLYALDYTILNNIFEEYKTVKDLYILSPSFLTKVHGRRGYKKGESTELAKYFIENILENQINVWIPNKVSETGRNIKGRLNNDKAESFIFLMRMFVKFNIYNLADTITKEVDGLKHEGEKLLRSR